ncbi:MAG: lipid A biosynthesis protein [Candidatus Binatia bacterium]|nr:MAG: lipid A biosynthesis protein [Candidatus Binatia bacterium]
MDRETLWLLLGFAGQVLFSLRFFVQWLRSERLGRSVLPVEFWYLSIGGSLALLLYAIHRVDPVFVLGQAGGLFVYTRNLWLLRRRGERVSAPVGLS